MKSRFGSKCFLLATALPILAIPASSGVIADLSANFTPVNFPTGWQYLRNTGAIGNNANYTPLLWDAPNNRYDITGASFPAPGPEFTFLGSFGHTHPGRGTAQGNAFNDYMIAAYTIQPGQAGLVSLINGSLTGNDPSGAGGASNGWDIRIYVGNAQAGSTLVMPWSLSAQPFSEPLGTLNLGDTVYVALGPSGSHLFDSAALEFQLDSSPVPEPRTFGLLALGIGIVGISVKGLVRKPQG